MNQPDAEPAKPVILYDGACGYCRKRIEQWNEVIRGHVASAPYQQALSRYPQVSEAQCRAAVQLIMPDGTVFSGAHAAFKALALSGRYRGWLWCYEHIALVDRLAEWLYRFIACRRSSSGMVN